VPPPRRVEPGKHGLDQRFGIRTRLQRFRRQAKAQSPEFPCPEDAADGLAPRPPVDQRHGTGKVGIADRTVTLQRQPAWIDGKAGGNEKPGIERRAVDIGVAQGVTRAAENLADGERHHASSSTEASKVA